MVVLKMFFRSITKYLDTLSLAEKLICIYVILLPIMRVPKLALLGYKLQYSEIVFVLLTAVWVGKLFQGKVKWITPPCFYFLALMLCAFTLSLINTENFGKSLIELSGIFYLCLLYAILNQFITKEKLWWQVIIVWCAISAVLSISGIAEFCAYSFFRKSTFLLSNFSRFKNTSPFLVTRIVSVFRHPTMFATYMHISIIFCSVLLFKYKKQSKLFAFFLVVLISCVIAAFLAKSRVFAGISISLFLIIASISKRSKLISLLRYGFFLCSIAFIGIVFCTTIWWFGPVKTKLDKTESRFYINFNVTPQFYCIQYNTALRMLASHPIVGIGIGMYNYKSLNYVNWEQAEASYKMYIPEITDSDRVSLSKGRDPHSTYFGWAAETGLIGLLSIIIFFAFLIVELYRKWSMAAIDKKFIYSCFLAGFIGYIINAWYVDIVTLRHFWFFMGMSAVILRVPIYGGKTDNRGENQLI